MGSWGGRLNRFLSGESGGGSCVRCGVELDAQVGRTSWIFLGKDGYFILDATYCLCDEDQM